MTEISLEVFFTLSVLFNFILEFKQDGSMHPIRDLELIAKNYLSGNFVFDVIPCIPLQYVNIGGREKMFYLIKIMRLYKGIQFMDVSAMVAYLGNYNTKVRLQNMINNDPVKANDTSKDNTFISYVLIGKYCLRVIKLVILIMTVTYFLGMFWFIICIELAHSSEQF